MGTLGAPVFIAAGIAYLTRRMAIGGWLFYYYYSLIGTMLFMPLLLSETAPFWSPSVFTDLKMYSIFMLYSFLPVVMKFLELAFALRLLFKSQRHKRALTILKRVLVLSVFVQLVSLGVGWQVYEDTAPLAGLMFSVVWCCYFYASERVEFVLTGGYGEWSYDAFVKYKDSQKPAAADW
jgi:hypothetical protein